MYNTDDNGSLAASSTTKPLPSHKQITIVFVLCHTTQHAANKQITKAMRPTPRGAFRTA